MKKILLLTALISAVSYSSSIDHIQTYSPDFLANQAQTGNINSVSANYNPAGLTRLEKGKYIHAGLQFATGFEKMSYKGKEHKSDLKQFIPDVSLYSVDSKGANFFTFGGIAGGGKLKYNGTAGIDVALEESSRKNPMVKALGIMDNGSQVKGSNIYEQITLGRAFNINEKLSFSIAGRLVHGSRKLSGDLKLGVSEENVRELLKKNPSYSALLKKLGGESLNGSIDSKREAYGIGVQLGVNYKVNEKLNLAARYDSRVKLNFKTKSNEKLIKLPVPLPHPDKNKEINELGFSTFFPQYDDGQKIRRDLPAILSLGASYKVTDRWLVSTSGNLYFNRQAKMDRIEGQSGSYKNGWELSLGNEYKLNDKFTLIGSISHAKTGASKDSYSDIEYAIDSTKLGVGIRYQYDDSLSVTGAIGHFIYNKSEGTYKEKHNVSENQKYDKGITAFGISFTKKF